MILLIFSSVFLSLLASIFFVYILTLLPPNQGRFKYGGVYSVSSAYYHVKYVILLALLKLRKWYNTKKCVGPLKMYDPEERRSLKKLEKLHCVSEVDSIDSVYFYCTGNLVSCDTNSDGHKIDIVVRIARRRNRVNEHWIMIRKGDQPLLVQQNAPETSIGNCSPNGWSTLTGVTVICDRPNEKWTVKYNGWLKAADNADNKIHVDLKMSFTAFTNIFDSHKDTSLELAADAIARESWSRDFFNELKSFQESKQTHYEQWGGYSGRMKIGRTESFVLHRCKGYRDHSFGIRNWSQYQRYGTFFGYLENGSCFSLGSICCRNTLSHIRHGYFITGYGDTRPITNHNFDLWKYFLTAPPRSQFVIEFYADGERYELIGKETAGTNFNLNEGTTNIFERFMTFTLNGQHGSGVGEYCVSDAVARHRYAPTLSIDIPRNPTLTNDRKHCISINDGSCLDKSVSGGKGCQLSYLAKLSKHYNQIVVPDGFVVTTTSFDEFVEANEDIRAAIERLQLATKDNSDESTLRRLCENIQMSIISGEIPHSLMRDLYTQLVTDIGEEWMHEKLAVRSSSADEDSDGASSAGQMETSLGVQGDKAVQLNLKKCWASQYSYQAVVYRSRYGQPVNAKMAVVIMKMVPSQISGVLFTVNPIDGDTTRMVINSTYGLGEAIVSGRCEPDNFVVEVDINGDLTVYSKVVGSKELRIDMANDGEELRVTEGEQRTEISMSDEHVLELSKIGQLIQRCYGEPCDIEWAFNDNMFYILQTRPITNLNIESDEEIIHEFDSAISMDEECLTTANIGEMMPMAVTPLTLSIFGCAIDRTMQTIPVIIGILKRYIYPRRYLPSFSNHLFINMHCILLIPAKSAFFSDIRIVFLALMGRVLDKPTKDDILRFGGTSPLLKRIIATVLSMKSRFQGTKKTLEWEKKFECGYKVPVKTNSTEQMTAIIAQLNDYYLCWLDTVANTSQSAIWSMVIMKMLEGKNGWTQHEYSQMATLLSTCTDVYSADVPAALKKIADAICKNQNTKELFLEMNPADCINWLHSSSSAEVGELYQTFLKRHGHRCIRESEFREKSWRTDQSKLISALKPMVTQQRGSERPVKKELSVQEAVDALQLNFNPIKKYLLKWILKKARRGVGLREWGKSLSIQMCELFKLSFNHLGELMVKEGLIPDADLLNFFTSDELMTILVDKDEPMSRFLVKAMRRRKIIDFQMKAVMPEVCYGTPDEEYQRMAHLVPNDSTTQLRGFPVSVGHVRGSARVISTLQEAADIKEGDILVVPYTDVGWTPYFPMLGGLVTEKGGLLSHGAVVAREYGLPCVVGCVGATTVFRTGDNLLLNATRGTVELITSSD